MYKCVQKQFSEFFGLNLNFKELKLKFLWHPSGFVKDVARPDYWVPDQDITQCHHCSKTFTPAISKHHCRACGQGVCGPCSKQTRAVPSRGWDHPVRVCDSCYTRTDSLWPHHNQVHFANCLQPLSDDPRERWALGLARWRTNISWRYSENCRSSSKAVSFSGPAALLLQLLDEWKSAHTSVGRSAKQRLCWASLSP